MANLLRPGAAACSPAGGGTRVLITSDPQLVSNLLEFYHQVFPDSCALTAGTDGPKLNDACDLIRQHFCTAAVEAITAAVEAQRLDIAEA